MQANVTGCKISNNLQLFPYPFTSPHRS